MFTPKKRFLSSSPDVAKYFAELAASSMFQEAAEVALVQLVADQPDTSDPVMAAACWQRVTGARAYLNLLLHIGTPAITPTPPKSTSAMNYKV